MQAIICITLSLNPVAWRKLDGKLPVSETFRHSSVSCLWILMDHWADAPIILTPVARSQDYMVRRDLLILLDNARANV